MMLVKDLFQGFGKNSADIYSVLGAFPGEIQKKDAAMTPRSRSKGFLSVTSLTVHCAAYVQQYR